MSPEPRSFTALCGGVDSRGWAAAAATTSSGDGRVRVDPLIERLILEFGDQAGVEVRYPTEWVERLGRGRE